MGYFSNGTEGEAYIEAYCDHCLHNCNGLPVRQADLDQSGYQEDGRGVSEPNEMRGCPVWFAHLMSNYEEANNPDSVLDLLIPRSKEGLGNEKCLMFVDRRQKERSTQCDLLTGGDMFSDQPTRFLKPTVRMVAEYMFERGYPFAKEAETFHDYHQSAGWKIGKNGKKPMKDWKAAVRTWLTNKEKFDAEGKRPGGKRSGPTSLELASDTTF